MYASDPDFNGSMHRIVEICKNEETSTKHLSNSRTGGDWIREDGPYEGSGAVSYDSK